MKVGYVRGVLDTKEIKKPYAVGALLRRKTEYDINDPLLTAECFFMVSYKQEKGDKAKRGTR